MIFESNNAQETYSFAQSLAAKAKPGDVYCLYGDLGVGKTVFSQGFAKGLGIEENVNSATFTIVQEYHSGRMPLYHMDVYRISDEEEMYEVGYEDMVAGEGVCLIEWAGLISGLLPKHYYTVSILRDPEKGFEYRSIEVTEVGD